MKLELVEIYKETEIKRNVETGSYYIDSPYNGKLRIFRDLKLAKEYLDNYLVLETRFIGSPL